MRVLFACDVLKYAAGGVKYYIHELVRHLALFDDIELTLLAEHPDELVTLPSHIRRKYYHFGKGYAVRSFNYLAVSSRHFAEYDIVHFPFSNVFLAMSRAMLRKGGPKTVVTVHDLIPLVIPEYRTLTLNLFYKLWMPRILNRASAILADSQYTKDDILKYYRVPADKIVVSYLGLKSQFQGIAPVTQKQPFFLAVSTVEPRKNFDRTVQAFLRFKETTPEWSGTLKIVGKLQFGHEKLLQLVANNPSVELLGPIDDAALGELYRNATGLLYPSLYEGFGLPILEAMALSCPVITSRLTSIPEVGGEAVIYVDPLDVDSIARGIRSLALDPVLRARYITDGVEQAKHFSWEKCATGVRDVYRQVLNGKMNMVHGAP